MRDKQQKHAACRIQGGDLDFAAKIKSPRTALLRITMLGGILHSIFHGDL
jgi:hypothetical protein